MEDPTATAFATGPADPAAAAALAELDASTLSALIATLRERGKRAHLELIGRAPIAKPLKKAAKKAAYTLRSARIGDDARPSAGVKMTTQPELSDVALVGAPGLSGRYWVLLAALPGAAPFAVELPGWGAGSVRATQLDNLTPATMRRYQREADESDSDHLDTASASLALRMIDHIAAEVRASGGDFGTDWERVLWWCAEARALGADPLNADARALLGELTHELPAPLRERTARLLDLREAGPHHPPEAAVEALLTQVAETADLDTEFTREELTERLLGLADASCDAFFADDRARARAARALEASADLLLHIGRRDEARQSLWLSDQLATGALLPHELGLLSGAFRRIINFEAAWVFHQRRLESKGNAESE